MSAPCRKQRLVGREPEFAGGALRRRPFGHGRAPAGPTARAAGNNGVTVAATQLASPALPGTTVTFDGFGRVSNADAIGLIDVTGAPGARALRVAVSSAGQVRVCDPLVADPNDPRKC